MGQATVKNLESLRAEIARQYVHAALLGDPSLSGKRPPFLLARVIADGTAKPYLEAHCGASDYAVCARLQGLPEDIRDVLWSEGSVWGSASREQRQRMREEELEVVIGSIRNDPAAQLRASLSNFWSQLNTFGLWGSYYPDAYILARIDEALPRVAESFGATRQGRGAIHEAFFGRLHAVTLAASLVSLGVFALMWWGRIPFTLARLAALVFFGIVGNAAITGVLSSCEGRYQSRVVWLVPLLACVAAASWVDRRRATDPHETARRARL